MKYLIFALALLVSTDALAGRSNHRSVFVRDVDCVILESDPEQYEGIAHVTFSGGVRVRMRFERGTNRDILNVCRELQAAEGTRVGAIYNFDLTPPAGSPSRIIHGFTHFQHSHIINGTVFDTRSLTESASEDEEDLQSDTDGTD